MLGRTGAGAGGAEAGPLRAPLPPAGWEGAGPCGEEGAPAPGEVRGAAGGQAQGALVPLQGLLAAAPSRSPSLRSRELRGLAGSGPGAAVEAPRGGSGRVEGCAAASGCS